MLALLEPGGCRPSISFPTAAGLVAALKSDGFKMLVADFDQAQPSGVTRSRDMLNLFEELGG